MKKKLIKNQVYIADLYYRVVVFFPLPYFYLGFHELHTQDNQVPKELIVVHHPQGHSLQHCIPTSTGSGFAMPFALQPLEQFRNKMVLLSGIDNQVAPLNSVSTAHPNAAYTFLTCQNSWFKIHFLTAGGPSIEEIIAQRISQNTYPRLDFAIGGTRSDNGIYLPHMNIIFGWMPMILLVLLMIPLLQ